MTGVNTSLLVLLDLRNKYQALDGIFHPQSFSRFTKTDQCLQHLSAHLTNHRLLHFFLPECEHMLIGADVVFLHTIYYIYCHDQISVNELRERYPTPMFVKIFHVSSLSTYVHQAAIAHLIEQAERTKHEPDEYDIALQRAAEHAETLANELSNYMIAKTSMQSDDDCLS